MKLDGHMVKFSEWKRLVEESAASEKIKFALIGTVKSVLSPEDDLIDSFRLGLLLGRISNMFDTDEALQDFLIAIQDTRNLDKLPIVENR